VLLAGTALLVAGCGRSGLDSATQRYRANRPDPAAPLPVPPEDGLWYPVERGDTLSAISRRSGIPVDCIRDANHLPSNLIKPGQKLWLPGCGGLHADPLAGSRGDAAIAGAGGFKLIPREEWTRARVGSNHRKMGRVTRLTLHHTGHHKGFVGKGDVDIVRMIDRYHREGRKWSSIGYHYLVGRDGSVYEGRPCHIQGAHVSSNNANNIGISCIGDFQKKLPTGRQLAALERFLDDRRSHYGIARKRVYAHRDLGQTICPGDALYGWFKRWRRS